ncbi:hypothetical protein CRD60_06825 [Bifidobacterium aemilianum]|uniref:Polysaccharide biosynthesis protein n=1 Tax=Bifidobacterium aemilianum TaxID=2493120 RepID=A0A366K896_9BIFI|nr:hypothetical protein [Bifidobacterium aemilianum]RBP97472.1 hypothetical protein CRD60_06825 [Bifidobacterium aemilianum]
MNLRKLMSNLSTALISQCVSLLLSITTSLLVPKILGIEEFGYWQLFMFYTSYVGFFHLGLNDGVYLINGGKSRSQIDKASINSQFTVGILYQTIFALCLVLFSILGPFSGQRQFVVCSTSAFLLLNNSAMFIGYIFQAMNETKLYSYSVILDKASFFIPLTLLLTFKNTDFRLYVVAYGCAKTCCLLFCLWNFKDFLTSGHKWPAAALGETRKSIAVGIRLMLANITGFLILGVIRFLVDFEWGISEFGKLSFAISLVNFIMTAVSQVSMVFFPALRQSDEHEQTSFFQTMRTVLALTLPLSYLAFFPLVALLSLWLPQYQAGFRFIALLLPLTVFNGRMDLIGTTYLKVLRKENLLLVINTVTLAFSALGALVGSYFHSITCMIIACVVIVIARSVFTEHLVASKLNVEGSAVDLGQIALTVIFYVAILLCPSLQAFLLMTFAYGGYLYIFNEEFKPAWSKIREAFLRCSTRS